MIHTRILSLFTFNDTATSDIYTLSLHDALPISSFASSSGGRYPMFTMIANRSVAASESGNGDRSVRDHGEHRSEEHTSELQSRRDLVCRLLLEKKKKNTPKKAIYTSTHKINN